jgi:sporulation protein YlmC with PRC-barrel domain
MMKRRRIHAEHLLGRMVYDIDNRRVGRIEEIEAEERRDGYYVTSFLLGEKGMLKRMSIWGIGPLLFRLLAGQAKQKAGSIPWERIDISNPKRPRLRCRKSDL